MTADRFSRVRAVYLAARELDGAEREAWLAATDAATRAEVEDLLAREATGFLDELRFSAMPGLADELPERVGPYRVLRRLGAGGMGQVLEVEQDNPRRRVALKLIGRALPSATELRRFEREIQALAELVHPNIARIYDAGSLPGAVTTRPFFTMELVEEGAPITRYASEHGLDRAQRVRLLIDVAEAVHHAHQRGVVHRDLKPDNVLVDAEGRPRVLDFGIAGLRREIDDAYLESEHGMVGTPAYLPPERVREGGRLNDARGDVFALGVVACELLVGRMPRELKGSGGASLLRELVETPATPVGALDPGLPRDLAAVVDRALAFDPEQRYGSAADLARDLERYLEGRPVSARRASAAYVTTRWVGRHRALAAGFGLALVALVAFGLARESRARARRAEADSLLIADYAGSILSGITPGSARGLDTTLLMLVLDVAVERIDDLDGHPLAEARIRYRLGRVFDVISELGRAREQYERALELQRGELGPDALETVETESGLALTLLELSEPGVAVELLEHALVVRESVLGPQHASTADALSNLGLGYARVGRREEARARIERAAEIRRSVGGASDAAVRESIHQLAWSSMLAGEYAEARELLDPLLLLDESSEGRDAPSTLTTLNTLAGALEKLSEKGSESMERSLELYRQALEGRVRVLGVGHERTISTQQGYALALMKNGQPEESERLFRAAIDALPKDHTQYPGVLMSFAVTLLRPLNRMDEALELLEQAVAASAEMQPPPYYFGRLLTSMGTTMRLMGFHDDAEAHLLDAYEFYAANNGESDPATRGCAAELWRLFDELGQGEQAETWKQRALAD